MFQLKFATTCYRISYGLPYTTGRAQSRRETSAGNANSIEIFAISISNSCPFYPNVRRQKYYLLYYNSLYFNECLITLLLGHSISVAKSPCLTRLNLFPFNV